MKTILIFLLSLSLYAENPPLKIVSWNIQNLGKCKLTGIGCKTPNDKIRTAIRDILAGNDLIFIQELSTTASVSNKDIQSFISQQFIKYKYVVSKNVGTTSGNRERFLVLYNPDKLEIDTIAYTDTPDIIRTPFVVLFKNIDISFITVHISANKNLVIKELEDLDTNTSGRFIVLGDFNASCRYFKGKLNETVFVDAVHWIGDNVDTTTKKTTNCAYDRVVSDKSTIIKNIKVIKNIDLKVSDHYPIYMELDIK